MKCNICNQDSFTHRICKFCGKSKCGLCFIHDKCGECSYKEFLNSYNIPLDNGVLNSIDVINYLTYKENCKYLSNEIIKFQEDYVGLQKSQSQNKMELIKSLNEFDPSCQLDENSSLSKFQEYISKLKNIKFNLLENVVLQLDILTSNEIELLKNQTDKIVTLFNLSKFKSLLKNIETNINKLIK